MKIFRFVLKALLVLYLIAGAGIYSVQEKILFRPDKLPDSYVFRGGEEIEIPVTDNVSLNCLLLKEKKAKGVILYLHGNRGHNQRCFYQAKSALAGNGYDIFMPDYRGYGKTEGEIYSEKQMYSDAQAVYDFLKKNYGEANISIAGYSMGTGLATYLAANNQPQQLFLIAPYYSIVDLKNRLLPFFPDFLLKYRFLNNENIQKVDCPITIFHGTSDEVIPYDSSTKLESIRPNEVELMTLKGVKHRQIIFEPKVRSKISRILY